ncbi:MAG TPA: MFS transporter [Candidatus Limnocylindrales bacterium]|nr:MFS transporter [Candidatus Limnocylindrales bacterium]
MADLEPSAGVGLNGPEASRPTHDRALLFAARAARMAGYGALSVVLVLYLVAIGRSDLEIGALLTLTLVGDVAVSLWLTTAADRLGRRRILVIGALLMAGAGVAFAAATSLPVLIVAATIGVISPSGNEVGPFLAVEQAALSEALPAGRRTRVFGWYNLVGSVATAVGVGTGGLAAGLALESGRAPADAYRLVIVGYALVGLLLAVIFMRLSPAAETRLAGGPATRFGLRRSQGIVARLAALFSLDAFAGGFVMQSLLVYWFHVRFGADPAVLGLLFFAANLLAAVSALAAARLAEKIGLVETMVVTHLPSNVLLILVPFMPTLPLAAAVLLARFSISQMDVPTRQALTIGLVDPDERSAAAGIAGVARSIGASLAPVLSAPLIGTPGLAGVPFVVAGGLKIAYDLLVYAVFRGPARRIGRGECRQ